MKRLSPQRHSLRAWLGLVVMVLQVLGALHFSLVRHGYSATLGGVVHLHGAARADKPQPKASTPRAAALSTDAPACGAELCPVGNAPAGSATPTEPLVVGAVAFGEARLLRERSASTNNLRRVFLSAPKTSPPV
ncbi:MAG TPA: hypothetical protein VFK05_35415 [Polyangiaceae bacterium]|nr:hypothetical protein [Polyangiaceae bacterium]